MYFRHIDKIGRMCMPKDCVKFLKISPGDKLIVRLNEQTQTIEIKKYEENKNECD